MRGDLAAAASDDATGSPGAKILALKESAQAEALGLLLSLGISTEDQTGFEMKFPHVLELIGYSSAALTYVLVLVLRVLWRRGKPLQEP